MRDGLPLWFWLVAAIAMGVALLVRGFRTRGRAEDIAAGNNTDHLVRERRPPRTQHYAFAHVLLRDRALADPAGTFDALVLPGCGDFLVDLWLAAHPADEAMLSPEGLRVDVDGDIAVVTLPPPARNAEVYMIAVARDAGAYFVLERGGRTPFLAEWRRDMRIRLGDVPVPTKREFLAAIRGELAARAVKGSTCST